MPPKKRSSSTRCAYREGNRRCPYEGSGKPSLCAAHRALLQHESKQAEQSRSPLGDLISDFLSGKKVNAQRVVGAFVQTVERGVQEGTAEVQWDDVGRYIPRSRPAAEPPPRRAPPPPQRPSPDEELAARVIAARKVMGFRPDETLTIEAIGKRKKELARKYHPDRPGGSVGKMAAINAAADLLIETLS